MLNLNFTKMDSCVTIFIHDRHILYEYRIVLEKFQYRPPLTVSKFT